MSLKFKKIFKILSKLVVVFFALLGVLTFCGIIFYNFSGENIKNAYMRVLTKKTGLEYSDFYELRSYGSNFETSTRPVAEFRMMIDEKDLMNSRASLMSESSNFFEGDLYVKGKRYRAQINPSTLEIFVRKKPSPWHWHWCSWFGLGFGNEERPTLEDEINMGNKMEKYYYKK
jgi:hypothetical protein